MVLSLAIQIVHFASLTQDGIWPVKTCGLALRSHTTRTAPIVQIFKTSQRLHRVHLPKAFPQVKAKWEKVQTFSERTESFQVLAQVYRTSSCLNLHLYVW